MHGVAVDPSNGHVFTGDGEANTVSAVDPVTMNVLRTVDVAATIDAIAYDPENRNIYAGEDGGTKVVVIDAATFKVRKTIIVPGHKPEYLAINPRTHSAGRQARRSARDGSLRSMRSQCDAARSRLRR